MFSEEGETLGRWVVAGGLVVELGVGDLLKDGGVWWCGLNVVGGSWKICLRVR